MMRAWVSRTSIAMSSSSSRTVIRKISPIEDNRAEIPATTMSTVPERAPGEPMP